MEEGEKTVMGCRTEMEELKNRHREHDRMTQRKKGQRAGQHWRKKTTVMGTGREIRRKKKY